MSSRQHIESAEWKRKMADIILSGQPGNTSSKKHSGKLTYFGYSTLAGSKSSRYNSKLISDNKTQNTEGSDYTAA